MSNVLYSKELSENLLSLRQFVDQGLQIFLDNRRINIFDPKSKERIISGINERPFWIVKLKIVKEVENKRNLDSSFALAVERGTKVNYNTRSKSKFKVNLENRENIKKRKLY